MIENQREVFLYIVIIAQISLTVYFNAALPSKEERGSELPLLIFSVLKILFIFIILASVASFYRIKVGIAIGIELGFVILFYWYKSQINARITNVVTGIATLGLLFVSKNSWLPSTGFNHEKKIKECIGLKKTVRECTKEFCEQIKTKNKEIEEKIQDELCKNFEKVAKKRLASKIPNLEEKKEEPPKPISTKKIDLLEHPKPIPTKKIDLLEPPKPIPTKKIEILPKEEEKKMIMIETKSAPLIVNKNTLLQQYHDLLVHGGSDGLIMDVVDKIGEIKDADQNSIGSRFKSTFNFQEQILLKLKDISANDNVMVYENNEWKSASVLEINMQTSSARIKYYGGETKTGTIFGPEGVQKVVKSELFTTKNYMNLPCLSKYYQNITAFFGESDLSVHPFHWYRDLSTLINNIKNQLNDNALNGFKSHIKNYSYILGYQKITATVDSFVYFGTKRQKYINVMINKETHPEAKFVAKELDMTQKIPFGFNTRQILREFKLDIQNKAKFKTYKIDSDNFRIQIRQNNPKNIINLTNLRVKLIINSKKEFILHTLWITLDHLLSDILQVKSKELIKVNGEKLQSKDDLPLLIFDNFVLKDNLVTVNIDAKNRDESRYDDLLKDTLKIMDSLQKKPREQVIFSKLRELKENLGLSYQGNGLKMKFHKPSRNNVKFRAVSTNIKKSI